MRNFILKKSIFMKLKGFNSNLGLNGKKLVLGEEREFCERYKNIFQKLELNLHQSLCSNVSKKSMILKKTREKCKM